MYKRIIITAIFLSLFLNHCSSDNSNFIKIKYSLYKPYISWLSNGKEIAFISNKSGSPDIYIIRVDGTGFKRFTDDGIDKQYFSWSPDGTKLVIMDYNDNYLVDAVTRKRKILPVGKNFIWSPDSSKIAFIYPTNDQIYMIDRNGENIKQLTFLSNKKSNLKWSPDSQKLVFTKLNEAREPSFKSNVFIININNFQVKQLTNDDYRKTNLSFTPDSENIIFERGNDIYLLKSDGSNFYKLKTGTYPSFPVCSTLSNKIIYLNNGIKVINLKGKLLKRISDFQFSNIASVKISPNNNHIAIVTKSTNSNRYYLHIFNV